MADKRPIIGPSQFSELTNSDGLIAGQSAVLSEQASSPGTPASGYGAIYAKTDGKVYFKNDAGTEYDLTATGGSGTNPIIREYIANATWTKPTASNFYGAMIMCFAAGGGGGSGRQGAASTLRGAGASGGGGAFTRVFKRAANLPNATYSITVGAGGSAGAAQTVNNTNGNNGGAGGFSRFGTIVSAQEGGLGVGGTTSTALAGTGGAIISCTPAGSPYSLAGNAGRQGGNNGLQGNTGYQTSQAVAAASGGSGGGITAANVAAGGGSGGGIYDRGVLFSGGNGGGTNGGNGGNGVDDRALYLWDYEIATTYGPGTAGGGGGPGDLSGLVAGGNGGTSGRTCGGAGGGASTNGANSGAGAAGGGGLVIVIEFYGA